MAHFLSSSSFPPSLSSSALPTLHSTGGHLSSSSSSVTAAVALVVAGCAAFFVIACCCLIFQLGRPLRLDQHRQPQTVHSSSHSQLLQLVHVRFSNRPPPAAAARQALSPAVEPVGLTQSQLDAVPDSVWQGDTRSADAEKERCSICLEEYEVGVSVVSKVRCGHVYHRECIRQWLSHNPTCPLCLTTLACGG